MRPVRAVAFSLFSLLLMHSLVFAEAPKRELVCKQCGMKITDDNLKFSVIVPSGIEYSTFDDIGCAVTWRDGECAMRQEAFDNNAVVHDYRTGDEIPIRNAFFVVDSGVRTPMGYGVLAFTSRKDADAFVAEKKQGKIVTYAVLDEFLKNRPMEMMHHGEGQHEMNHHDMQHHDSGGMHHQEQHN